MQLYCVYVILFLMRESKGKPHHWRASIMKQIVLQ